MKKRQIVNFYELPVKWQKEAIKNLDEDFAKDNRYLKPLSKQTPKRHILWNLSECMPLEGNPDGFNAYITISNNSTMLLKIDDSFETAIIKFI